MHTQPTTDMASQMAAAVRMLAADAVERAISGRIGAPMGMAGFGELAPAKHLSANFGLTIERVVQAVQAVTTGGQHHA